MNEKPDILRFADFYENHSVFSWDKEAVAEMRRLYDVNLELLGTLIEARWKIANLVGSSGAQGLDRDALTKIDFAIAKATGENT